MKWKYSLIGAAFDLIDLYVMFTVFGVPVFSVCTTLFWIYILGPVGVANAVQCVPGISALPINVALGFMADTKGKR